MKKLILAILFILCLSFQASAWNPMVVTSGGEAATYPDIILDMNSEETWVVDTTYTADDPTECHDEDIIGAIAGGGFAEETGSPLSGASSFMWVGSYDRVTFTYTTSMSKGRIGAYLKIDSYNVDTEFLKLYNTGSPYQRAGFKMTADNTVTALFYDGSGGAQGIITSTNDFNTNDHYVEVAWDTTVGVDQDYVKLYVDGSLEATDDDEVFVTLDFNVFYIGNPNATTGAATVDRVRISTDPTRDLNALKTIDTLTGACP